MNYCFRGFISVAVAAADDDQTKSHLARRSQSVNKECKKLKWTHPAQMTSLLPFIFYYLLHTYAPHYYYYYTWEKKLLSIDTMHVLLCGREQQVQDEICVVSYQERILCSSSA